MFCLKMVCCCTEAMRNHITKNFICKLELEGRSLETKMGGLEADKPQLSERTMTEELYTFVYLLLYCFTFL